MRERYGYRGNHSLTPIAAYAGAAANLTRKIMIWRKAVRRLDREQERLEKISRHVRNFTGLDPKYSFHEKGKDYMLCRKIFFKHALEKGFRNAHIMDHVRGPRSYSSNNVRMRFTRSFKKNADNRTAWHNFMNYIKLRK